MITVIAWVVVSAVALTITTQHIKHSTARWARRFRAWLHRMHRQQQHGDWKTLEQHLVSWLFAIALFVFGGLYVGE